MVRMRCRIAEDESARCPREKLRTTLDEHLTDPEERRFVEPQLAHLLGLSRDRPTGRTCSPPGGCSSSARRGLPHGARVRGHAVGRREPARLLEHLLEWSRTIRSTCSPWPARARRAATDLGRAASATSRASPDPLSARRWASCSTARARPPRPHLRGQILDRAEGVPLYAVETVRMLLDRGALVQEGSVYSPTGPIGVARRARDAARADRGTPRWPLTDERRLLQDAAVLGKTFTGQASRLGGADGDRAARS